MSGFHLDKHNGIENIHPNTYIRIASTDIDSTLVKTKSLLEVMSVKRIVLEMQTPATCFQ